VELRDQIVRSIIDGPIDADKIDYLIRDSENLRVPYGAGIDYERLVQSLTITIQERLNRSKASVGIHEGGKIAAESVAFARYALYGAVYWHRTHRAAKSMIQRVAYEAMQVYRDKDVTRKEGWITSLRSALYAFLDHGVEELRLPGLIPDTPSATQGGLLDPATTRMLRWLDDQGVRGAHSLVAALLERKLFKRVLVVSRGYQSAVNWDTIDTLYGDVGRRWEERRTAGVLLQGALVERIAAFAQEERTVSTVTPDLADHFVTRARREPLVLIDHPPDKPGASDELLMLRENEGGRPGEDDFTVDALEGSALWSQLRKQQPVSLAKLRVFAHPDFRNLLRVVIPRDDFEKLVRDAVSEALYGRPKA
jgi:hypothetical protein